MQRRVVRGFFSFLVLIYCNLAYGQSITVGPDGKFEKQVISVLYAFYNESFGVAGAYAYAVNGWPQKQSALIATAMVGSQESAMGFIMGRDLQIPYVQRLFLDAIVQAGYFQKAEIYTSGNPDYPHERAGSNDSGKDDYVESDGWDNFFRLWFKYLLPIGHGKDEIISTQVVDRGLLVDGATGGESWNPFDGRPWLQQYLGVQWLQFVPFVEIGRVAPDWNVDDLHEDMKWSAGLGVRFWAKGLVARIDSAVSDEGFGVQMMVSQPFQF